MRNRFFGRICNNIRFQDNTERGRGDGPPSLKGTFGAKKDKEITFDRNNNGTFFRPEGAKNSVQYNHFPILGVVSAETFYNEKLLTKSLLKII